MSGRRGHAADRGRPDRRAEAGLRVPHPRRRRLRREPRRPHHLAATRETRRCSSTRGDCGGRRSPRPTSAPSTRDAQRRRRQVGCHPGDPHPHRAAPPPAGRVGGDPQPSRTTCRVLAALGVLPQVLHQNGSMFFDDLEFVQRVHGRDRLGRLGCRAGRPDRRRVDPILASHGVIVTGATIEEADLPGRRASSGVLSSGLRRDAHRSRPVDDGARA